MHPFPSKRSSCLSLFVIFLRIPSRPDDQPDKVIPRIFLFRNEQFPRLLHRSIILRRRRSFPDRFSVKIRTLCSFPFVFYPSSVTLTVDFKPGDFIVFRRRTRRPLAPVAGLGSLVSVTCRLNRKTVYSGPR